jgi:hypothetical protein
MRQPWRERGIVGQRTSPQQLQQGLGHRPVWSAGRGGDGPTRRYQHLPVGSHLRQLPYQAGLADASLTGDDGAAAMAGQRSGQGRLQGLDLGPPAYQDRAQHLPPRLQFAASAPPRLGSGMPERRSLPRQREAGAPVSRRGEA